MDRIPTVYLTVPNGKAWIHKHTHFAIFNMMSNQKLGRIRHDCPTHSPYVDNLHACMNDFLNGGEDYWISMDDDNPPRNNPLELLKYDFDLIGLPTPVWHSAVPGDRPWYFNALTKVGEEGYRPLPAERYHGIQEVDAIGSGCFIVARRVVEALKDQQPFMRQWAQNGRVIKGGDYSFCDKVRAAGFKIFVSFDHICEHFNEVPLLEVIDAFGKMHAKVQSEAESSKITVKPPSQPSIGDSPSLLR